VVRRIWLFSGLLGVVYAEDGVVTRKPPKPRMFSSMHEVCKMYLGRVDIRLGGAFEIVVEESWS